MSTCTDSIAKAVRKARASARIGRGVRMAHHLNRRPAETDAGGRSALGIVDDLQERRHVAAELRVGGAGDLAPPAGAERHADVVGPQPYAPREAQSPSPLWRRKPAHSTASAASPRRRPPDLSCPSLPAEWPCDGHAM